MWFGRYASPATMMTPRGSSGDNTRCNLRRQPCPILNAIVIIIM